MSVLSPLVRWLGRVQQLPAGQHINTTTPVVTIAAASATFDAGALCAYLRFTAAGDKTATFSGPSFLAGHEYHVANRSASGDLTLIAGAGITLTPSKGGTLVLEPGDTVTVKFISSTSADVFGSTKGAA